MAKMKWRNQMKLSGVWLGVMIWKNERFGLQLCIPSNLFFFFFWEWCKQTRSIWAPTFLPFSVFSVAFIHLIFHWVDASFLSDLSSTSDLLSVTIFFFFSFHNIFPSASDLPCNALKNTVSDQSGAYITWTGLYSLFLLCVWKCLCSQTDQLYINTFRK